MGTDKAFLKLGDRSLLDRATLTLRSLCSEVAIVGDLTKFRGYGTVVEDVFKGAGPLAGIHAALRHSSAELNLILAVDLPFVSVDLLEFLFTCAENSDAVVTVPRTTRGFQPLCAVYRREFAAVAEQAMRAGRYKIDALFDSVPLRVVEESELNAQCFFDRMFANLNTPEDVQAARSDSR